MRKIYVFINSLFKKLMGKHDEKVTVELEFRELTEDQVPEAIRREIEKKEKEMKEAQM